jgi:succinate dehydrogenase / fumarate reductase flavoprotein subunit
VDYNLMTTIPGCFCLGEANFSDHGANRLGASALMQGLADGYFVIPYTIGGYLAGIKPGTRIKPDHPAVKAAEEAVKARNNRLLSINGKETPTEFHRALGRILWENCGMGRTEASLTAALKAIPELRQRFWENLRVPGTGSEVNQSLELAGRVGDFLELGELLCLDALERRESCGAHFREEWQTPDGEAVRDDQNFCHVAAWEYTGPDSRPIRNVEPLEFEYVHLATRSYK